MHLIITESVDNGITASHRGTLTRQLEAKIVLLQCLSSDEILSRPSGSHLDFLLRVLLIFFRVVGVLWVVLNVKRIGLYDRRTATVKVALAQAILQLVLNELLFLCSILDGEDLLTFELF